jgi:hypothetical protein
MHVIGLIAIVFVPATAMYTPQPSFTHFREQSPLTYDIGASSPVVQRLLEAPQIPDTADWIPPDKTFDSHGT